MSHGNAQLTSRQELAFAFAVPIAFLGGLIGLGGAEFRLPVLAGPLGYSVRQAVPINLAVSIVTIAASLAIRSRSLSLAPVAPFTPALLALIAGAVVAAVAGTALFDRLSDERIERIILALLLVVGVALIVEGLLPHTERALLPEVMTVWIVAGVIFGLGVGLVSSLLGVAGGEIIIPTLIFAYGVDIKTAGTASLLISLPTLAVGIARYARRGAYARPAIAETVMPMGIGSVLGAVIGGLLVGIVSGSFLKVGLGLILIVSAWHTFRHSRSSASSVRDRANTAVNQYDEERGARYSGQSEAPGTLAPDSDVGIRVSQESLAPKAAARGSSPGSQNARMGRVKRSQASGSIE